MITQPDSRLMSLFEFAVDLEPEQRARFVAHACPDRALRGQLEAMLVANDKSTRSILSPAQGRADTQARRPASQPARAVATRHLDECDTVHAKPPEAWFADHAATPTPPQTISLASVSAPAAPAGGGRPDQRATPGHAARPRTGDGSVIESVIKPGLHIQHYELIREIGRGGMGAVFMARDTKLGRRVAIKFLHTDERKLTERFVLEARATARCSHENIIVIHDVSHYQAVPYMVLEYLKGQPLNKLLGDERVSPSRAVQLLAPVVRALVCAHEHKIVHRDLKPANIFMTETGTIKVLDFGIAKFVYDMPAVAHGTLSEALSMPGKRSLSDITMNRNLGLDLELTGRGALVGTLPYMSPEQWGADTIDHRTDIWAVGIMLYRMICGRHPLGPLRGEQFVVTTVLDQPMPSAHAAGVDMPLGLADIIDSCLKKRKNERMPSAAKLLSALERYLPGRRPTELDSEECPYAGLSAFQETDANRFFGRTRESGSIVARLHNTPLLAIVGPSGAGKSSLVRAGVIPTLQHSGESWESLIIRPGRHPMAALANLVVPMVTGDSSLSQQVAEHQKAQQRLYSEPGYLGTVLRARARSCDGRLLLFIDQFEELFTMSPDQAERRAFTACLAGMADDPMSPLRLVLSIRSDFLDRVAEDRQFMSELSQGLYFVGPPDRSGLREAIVKPAELLRYRFEDPSMVEHMLDTLQATPGCLPLLQFAASKLWDGRDQDGRVLTRASYDALGGVVGALATHADAVLTALPPPDQRLVRTVFLHLVTPERTRAIKSIAELREVSDAGDGIDKLIQHLVDARLLIVQKSERSGKEAVATVEIVHESMIHSWPTLAHWLEENQEDAVFLEQLYTAARQWDGRGRVRELLWRGEPLAEALAWRKRYKDRLPGLQEAFLAAGAALAARVARRRRLALVGGMAFLSVIAVAAVIGLLVIREGERELRAKEAARLAAVAKMDDIEAMSRQELERANQQLQATNANLERTHEQMELALETAQRAEVRKAKALDQLKQEQGKLRDALNDAISAKVVAEAAREEAERSRMDAVKAKDEARAAQQQADKARGRMQHALTAAKKANADLAKERQKDQETIALLKAQKKKNDKDTARITGGLED